MVNIYNACFMVYNLLIYQDYKDMLSWWWNTFKIIYTLYITSFLFLSHDFGIGGLIVANK